MESTLLFDILLFDHILDLIFLVGLPRWVSGKDSTCNSGDTVGVFPGSGRPLGEEMATYSSMLA